MSRSLRLFIPCYVDELWPSAAIAAVELSEAVGYRVSIEDAACCGQALDNAGESAAGARVRATLMQGNRDDEIVVLSASCAGHLQATRSAAASEPRVREWCEWFTQHAPDEFPRSVDRRVALHSSCSSLRATRTDWAARDLLGRVRGLTVAQPESHDECCGFGGSFASEFAELSVRMGADKVRACLEADARGVDAIVSVDCSCLLHLKAMRSHDVECLHVAEILRDAG